MRIPLRNSNATHGIADRFREVLGRGQHERCLDHIAELIASEMVGSVDDNDVAGSLKSKKKTERKARLNFNQPLLLLAIPSILFLLKNSQMAADGDCQGTKSPSLTLSSTIALRRSPMKRYDNFRTLPNLN